MFTNLPEKSFIHCVMKLDSSFEYNVLWDRSTLRKTDRLFLALSTFALVTGRAGFRWSEDCFGLVPARMGAATAGVARVQILSTFENPTWIRPILCSEVVIHYYLDPTILSTPVAPLGPHDLKMLWHQMVL